MANQSVCFSLATSNLLCILPGNALTGSTSRLHFNEKIGIPNKEICILESSNVTMTSPPTAPCLFYGCRKLDKSVRKLMLSPQPHSGPVDYPQCHKRPRKRRDPLAAWKPQATDHQLLRKRFRCRNGGTTSDGTRISVHMSLSNGRDHIIYHLNSLAHTPHIGSSALP